MTVYIIKEIKYSPFSPINEQRLLDRIKNEAYSDYAAYQDQPLEMSANAFADAVIRRLIQMYAVGGLNQSTASFAV